MNFPREFEAVERALTSRRALKPVGPQSLGRKPPLISSESYASFLAREIRESALTAFPLFDAQWIRGRGSGHVYFGDGRVGRQNKPGGGREARGGRFEAGECGGEGSVVGPQPGEGEHGALNRRKVLMSVGEPRGGVESEQYWEHGAH